MKWMTNITKNRMLLGIVATFALSLVVASPALGQTTDTFGIDRFGNETELGNEDVPVTIARIINVALSLLGVVAVVIILAGGFKIMTSGGSEDKNAEGRKLIIAGIVGLAIILSAFAIARFVLGQLSSATGSGSVNGFEG